MITIRRIDAAISMHDISGAATVFPAVYVFFNGPNVESLLPRLFSEPEDGEIVVLGGFEAGGRVAEKFGVKGPESMLGFGVAVFSSSADGPSEYEQAIRDTRGWRHRNRRIEEKYYPDKPWKKDGATSA